jgi:hypothetical protein
VNDFQLSAIVQKPVCGVKEMNVREMGTLPVLGLFLRQCCMRWNGGVLGYNHDSVADAEDVGIHVLSIGSRQDSHPVTYSRILVDDAILYEAFLSNPQGNPFGVGTVPASSGLVVIGSHKYRSIYFTSFSYPGSKANNGVFDL